MTYTVATGTVDGRAHHWWAYFLAFGWGMDPYLDLQDALNKHNSKARIINPVDFIVGDPIMFETEQDFTMFVLRWG